MMIMWFKVELTLILGQKNIVPDKLEDPNLYNAPNAGKVEWSSYRGAHILVSIKLAWIAIILYCCN